MPKKPDPDPDEVVTVHAPGVLRRARMRRKSIYGPWQVCRDPQAPVTPPKRRARRRPEPDPTTTQRPTSGTEQE